MVLLAAANLVLLQKDTIKSMVATTQKRSVRSSKPLHFVLCSTLLSVTHGPYSNSTSTTHSCKELSPRRFTWINHPASWTQTDQTSFANSIKRFMALSKLHARGTMNLATSSSILASSTHWLIHLYSFFAVARRSSIFSFTSTTSSSLVTLLLAYLTFLLYLPKGSQSKTQKT